MTLIILSYCWRQDPDDRVIRITLEHRSKLRSRDFGVYVCVCLGEGGYADWKKATLVLRMRTSALMSGRPEITDCTCEAELSSRTVFKALSILRTLNEKDVSKYTVNLLFTDNISNWGATVDAFLCDPPWATSGRLPHVSEWRSRCR